MLGKLPVPGRPSIWITVGQGPIALAVGAGGVVWTFLLSTILSSLSSSLWESTRYRLKYWFKGPLKPKQPTNQPTIWMIVGQGPIALAVGADGSFLDIFTLLYPFSPLSPSLWETARYRLKYCPEGPLNNQPTKALA